MPSNSEKRRRQRVACYYTFALIAVSIGVIAFFCFLVFNITSTTAEGSGGGGGGGGLSQHEQQQQQQNADRADEGYEGGDDDDNRRRRRRRLVPEHGKFARSDLSRCPAVGWRAPDGSDRGMAEWAGSAGTRKHRYVYPGYMVEDYDERGRPNARLVSNAVCHQPDGVAKHEHYTSAVWSFGQFVDHLITLAPHACGDGAAPDIEVDVTGDAHFDPHTRGAAMRVAPSDWLASADWPRHRHPINSITHFVDGNTVYGSTAARTAYLRRFEHGLLNLQTVRGGAHGAGGEQYPPRNVAGFANVGGRRNASMFACGDERANEQMPLTTMHVLFLREHNYQARRMRRAHPDWNDECLFQAARRVVVGELQRVVFDEFVPALLGYALPPAPRAHNASVDVRIYAEFSGAAYRLHTLVNDELNAYDPLSGAHTHTIALRDAFMNPAHLLDVGTDALLLGIFRGRAERLDTRLVRSLTDFLFHADGEPLDLCAINIVRGREQGLPHFSELRARFGLPPLRSWHDADFEPDVRDSLRAAYGAHGYANLDLFVGLMAERADASARGSGGGGRRRLGATLDAIVRDQFLRLRDGDPHYYHFDAEMGAAERAYIKHTTLRDIVLRNTRIRSEHLPRNLLEHTA